MIWWYDTTWVWLYNVMGYTWKIRGTQFNYNIYIYNTNHMNWIWANKRSRTTPPNAMVHQGKMIVNSKRRTTIEAAGDHRDAIIPNCTRVDGEI